MGEDIKFIYNRDNIYISLLSFLSVCLVLGTSNFFGKVNLLHILLPVALYSLSLLFMIITYKVFNIRILIDSLVYILLPTLIIFSTGEEFGYSVYILWIIAFLVMSIVCIHELLIVKDNIKSQLFYLNVISGMLLGIIFSLSIIYSRASTIILPMVAVIVYLLTLAWYNGEKNISKLDSIKLFIFCIILLLLKISCTTNILNSYHFLVHITYIIYTIWLILSFRNHLYKQSIIVGCLLIIGLFMPHNQANVSLEVEAVAFISAISVLFFIKTPTIYSIKTKYAHLKILDNNRNNTRLLFSNLVLQGLQSLDDEKKFEPTSYFCKEGPIGQVFRTLQDKLKNIAVIGLGTGTAAAYGHEGQNVTFYEIDQVMKEIAYDYFSYLRDSKADIKIVLGDARETLVNVNDHSYDMIICDAYIGADTPQNLMTYEAIRLYISKLTNNGILCLHISGRNETFINMISKNLKEAGLYGFIQSYNLNNFQKPNIYCEVDGLISMKTKVSSYSLLGKIRKISYIFLEKIMDQIGMVNERANACQSSRWICAARDEKYLFELIVNPKWKPLDFKDNVPLITDQTIGYTTFADG
ncbi:Spermidine synthase [Rickettsiales bacterium Ac37b]|nr:Spermidine synthase [Rickettsiales bacterium Ac37b]